MQLPAGRRKRIHVGLSFRCAIAKSKLLIKQKHKRYIKAYGGVGIFDTLFLYPKFIQQFVCYLMCATCALLVCYVAKFKATVEHCKPR